MNQNLKAVLGAFVLMGGFTALVLCFGGDIEPDMRKAGAILGGFVVAAAIALLIVALRKDKAPDFLKKLSAKYFQRDGLAFLVTPANEGGIAFLDCYFQNRYAGDCEANVVLTATSGNNAVGASRLSMTFPIQCPPAAFGRCRMYLPVARELQGSKVVFAVTAAAKFPRGKGQLIRYGEGLHVGKVGGNGLWLTLLGLLAGAIVFSRSAKITLAMPASTPPPIEGPSPQIAIFWKLGNPVDSAPLSK